MTTKQLATQLYYDLLEPLVKFDNFNIELLETALIKFEAETILEIELCLRTANMLVAADHVRELFERRGRTDQTEELPLG